MLIFLLELLPIPHLLFVFVYHARLLLIAECVGCIDPAIESAI